MSDSSYLATGDTASPGVPRAPAAPARPGEPQQLVPPVSQRPGAVVDSDVVHVVADAAVKDNTFPSRPGYPSGRAHWQTQLHLEARVKNVTYAKEVWADVNVYAHDGGLVGAQTLALHWVRPDGDGGDLFVLDGPVYEGSVAGSGSVEPRPDVRALQYRLYCELDRQLFTDGVLHRCDLRSDTATA